MRQLPSAGMFIICEVINNVPLSVDAGGPSGSVMVVFRSLEENMIPRRELERSVGTLFRLRYNDSPEIVGLEDGIDGAQVLQGDFFIDVRNCC